MDSGGSSGGFDAVWPGAGADAHAGDRFAEEVVRSLASRGYFVAQVTLGEEERKEALRIAEGSADFQELREELAVDVVGRANVTKVIRLGPDDPTKEPSNILGHCDRLLTEAGMLLAPLALGALGFLPVGRSEGLARLRFSSSTEAARFAPLPLAFSDEEEGVVEGHLSFVRRRKVCLLYMIDNDGGELSFFAEDGKVIVLPLTRDKLVMFRHDLFSYEYRPRGSGLAIQSWMMAPEPAFVLSRVEGLPQEKDAAMLITGPTRPEGVKAQVLSAATRLPAKGDSMASYWQMVQVATDADTQWPIARCDLNIYYSSDDFMLTQKSYTCHGGWLDFMEAAGFDNAIFGIPEAEAKTMSLNQRMWMEVGYQALLNAGWTKDTLSGKAIGTYLGDVGADWHSLTGLFSLCCYNPDYSATALTSAVAPARLAYCFNLRGPTMTFDTACSSSLVATHHGHMQELNWNAWGTHSDGALCGGVNSLDAPGFVGNCMANMLSHIGRCFTFDRTADGYQRGEGTGGFFMRLTENHDDVERRLACLVGSCANQDGRSASLTAPNGPSQQSVIRKSLHMAGIHATEVTAVECHGTGTALGDPIEVGALLAVLEDGKELPLPHTSAKSNISHLESAAGVAGLLKCICILLRSCATPNVHLKSLNPHLVSAGFPQIFQTEMLDTGSNSGYMGVSSFGFGGTNSRSDVYGLANSGPRQRMAYDCSKLDIISSPCPKCEGQMCWRCGVAIPTHTARTKHRCTLIRDEWADYDTCSYCYEGAFRYGEAIEDLAPWTADDRVFITGTWNAWTQRDELELSEDGVYTCGITLGDCRWEEFQLVVNDDPNCLFYPATAKANPSIRIHGPDTDGKGKTWLIDGRADCAPAGTAYKLVFQWSEPRRIHWEVAAGEEPDCMLACDYPHRYFLVGSATRWTMQEMQPCERPGLHGTTFTIGSAGFEEFHCVRDRDSNQAIYPEIKNAEETSIAVRGPDSEGPGKTWLIRGIKGEVVTVRLHVSGGFTAVEVCSASAGQRRWESAEQ